MLPPDGRNKATIEPNPEREHEAHEDHQEIARTCDGRQVAYELAPGKASVTAADS